MDSRRTTNVLLIIVLALLILIGLLYFLLPRKSQAPETPTSTASSTNSSVFTYKTETILKTNPTLFYSIKANYPVFSFSNSSSIQQSVNESIYNQVLNDVNDAEKSFSEDSGQFSGANASDQSSFDLESLVINNSRLNNILAVKLDESFYQSGSAHGGETFVTLNYNLDTGGHLALADLFAPGSNYLKAISDYSITALKNKLGEEAVASDIENGAGADADNFQNFLVTDNGLTLIFNEYQVAAYAAGAQEITIPWGNLGSILNPELHLI